MNSLKNEKGITLIALIITIVITVIITGIAISSGTESLDETRLKGFYTTLEIVQKRVDDISVTNEAYVDNSGNTIYLKEQGTAYSSLTDEKKANLNNILTTECAGLGLSSSNFRYFTSEQLKNVLDLSDIDYNVFIDFNSKVVIAEDGILLNGTTYHVLKNDSYFVSQDTNKNVGIIESLTYTASSYGSNMYKIIVTPNNLVGDLTGGTLKYKKTTTKYWEDTNNLEMIVDELTSYNIIYKDNNNNNLAKTITLAVNSEGQLTVTEE